MNWWIDDWLFHHRPPFFNFSSTPFFSIFLFRCVENCMCTLRNLSYRTQEVDDPNYDQVPAAGASANGGVNGTNDSKSESSTGCFGAAGKGKKEDSQIGTYRPAGNQRWVRWLSERKSNVVLSCESRLYIAGHSLCHWVCASVGRRPMVSQYAGNQRLFEFLSCRQRCRSCRVFPFNAKVSYFSGLSEVELSSFIQGYRLFHVNWWIIDIISWG